MAPKNDGNRWTRVEDKKLRELARDVNVSTDKIARQLGRTVDAIRSEAHRKGISLRPRNK